MVEVRAEDKFAFIKDPDLKKIIGNSVKYIYIIHNRSKRYKKKLYLEETYRVIVLYVVSVIESILLYFYKKRGEKIKYPEYKLVHILPNEYQHKEKNGRKIVIAIQEEIEKREHQIGLHELVHFFKDTRLMPKNMADEILEINEVRNTFHFNKRREDTKLDLERVEQALRLLADIIEKVPKIF